MKKLLLSVALASAFSMNTAIAENLYNESGSPDRLVIFEYEGKYSVSGYPDGNSYAEAQEKIIKDLSDKRISELSGSDSNKAQNKATIEAERDAAIDLLKVKAEYADLAISNMKSGMNSADAKKAAARETLDAQDNTAGLQSGYNNGSVTSSLTENAGSSASGIPTVSNNDFKQFNELDCNYSEVSNYIDKSLDGKTKAFATTPSYSKTFKNTATKSAVSLKGEDEAACQTIFHDAKFSEMGSFSMTDLVSGIPTLSETGVMLAAAGAAANAQMQEIMNSIGDTLREGFCTRMSSEYLGDLAGDLVEDEYKEASKGTSLDGTKINSLDKESGQNNFTYKVIKNQSEISDSDLIKAIDVTRDDQADYQKDFIKDGLDDVLDDLEDDIFG